GKTSMARAIASELGLQVVSADSIRKALFGEQIAAKEYGQGAYSPEANIQTYTKMLECASESILSRGGVVLDPTFRRRSDRDNVRRLAQSLGADFRFILCHLDPALIKQRLDRRVALKEGRSDATWLTYLRQSQEFESIDQAETAQTRTLDTERPLSHCAREVCDWLRSSISEKDPPP
ncbi:MAG: AAA family ATPase, partial [Blastocatellia bacterium]